MIKYSEVVSQVYDVIQTVFSESNIDLYFEDLYPEKPIKPFINIKFQLVNDNQKSLTNFANQATHFFKGIFFVELFTPIDMDEPLKRLDYIDIIKELFNRADLPMSINDINIAEKPQNLFKSYRMDTVSIHVEKSRVLSALS